MKLPTTAVSVVSGGTTHITKSRIIASSKMFEILSSQLYSNKVEAVVREISTNALDAHIAAGTPDRPIVVHLPTTFDPYFSVRDYGPGLTPTEVDEIYPHYGMSTKEQDVQAVGCLGLGSKSPLAYTENFQVTSWVGGVARVYAIYKCEDKSLGVDLLSETPSDEPSGLEVKVGVQSGDFGSFRDAADRVYGYFNVKPIAEGRTFEPPAYRLRTTIAGLLAPAGSRQGKAWAVMGNVRYPIDKDELCRSVRVVNPRDPTGPRVAQSYRIPSGCDDWNIDLYVGLGDLEFTPSREALSYNAATVQRLRTAFDQARDEIVAQVSIDFDKLPTRWEARKKIKSFGEFSAFAGDLTWRGLEVKPQLNFSKVPAPPSGFKYPAQSIDYHKDYSWKAGKAYQACDLPDRWNVDDSLKAVLIDDITPKPGRLVTVRRFLDTHHDGKGVVFVFHEDQLPQALIDEYGFGHLVERLSAHRREPAKRVKAEKSKQPRALLQEISGDGNLAEAGPIDLEGGGVYVRCARGRVFSEAWLDPDGKTPRSVLPSSAEFRSAMECLAALDGKTTTIFGVREGDIPRLEKAGSWESFDEYARRVITAAKPKYHHSARAYAGSLTVSKIDASWARDLVRMTFPAGSAFGEYAVLRRQADSLADGASPTRRYARMVELWRTETIDPDPSLKLAMEAVKARYPLIFSLQQHYYVAIDAKDVKRYIDLIDAAAAPTAPASAARVSARRAASATPAVRRRPARAAVTA